MHSPDQSIPSRLTPSRSETYPQKSQEITLKTSSYNDMRIQVGKDSVNAADSARTISHCLLHYTDTTDLMRDYSNSSDRLHGTSSPVNAVTSARTGSRPCDKCIEQPIQSKASLGNIWNRENGNHENESLIQNALDLHIIPTRLSRSQVLKRGESFI